MPAYLKLRTFLSQQKTSVAPADLRRALLQGRCRAAHGSSRGAAGGAVGAV